MNRIITSEYALKAQTVLWQTHRSSRIVGWGTPPEVYYQNDWKLEILKSDSNLPSEVRTRLRILQEKGVKFTHVLIAHQEKPKEKRLEIPKKVTKVVSNVLPVSGTILGVLGAVLSLSGLVVFRVIQFLLTVDPVVIVVLEDKTWLEIAKWYD